MYHKVPHKGGPTLQSFVAQLNVCFFFFYKTIKGNRFQYWQETAWIVLVYEDKEWKPEENRN